MSELGMQNYRLIKAPTSVVAQRYFSKDDDAAVRTHQLRQQVCRFNLNHLLEINLYI